MSPIARLSGTVLEVGPDWLIVDVGGMGFQAYCPGGTLARAHSGAEIALRTHLSVREDGLTLYGFISSEEQRLFQTLLGVSGVGPKAALALLTVMAADELAYAIASGNAAALGRAPGVGKKLASRIILELGEKMGAVQATTASGDGSEVVAALMSLGYSQAEASEAATKTESAEDAPVEERVRNALGWFAKGPG